AIPCITRPPRVSVWGDDLSFLGQLPIDGDCEQAGSVRVPWPCTRSFTRARGLNSLRSTGLGLFANNVVSEACLWAVCKQCGLICGYCGSDVPRVCSECGLKPDMFAGQRSDDCRPLHLGILTVLLLMIPLAVFSQDRRRGDYGYLQVTNDWERPVTVTLWKERGEQLSRRTWTIRQ